jgi:hypothetical protein
MCFALNKDLRFMNKFLFRNQVLLKRKMRRNDNDDEMLTKRINYTAYWKSLTKLSENVEWKEANHRKKKIEFRQIFRIIDDSSSSFWRLIRWARIRSHKSKDTSKISNFSRRDAKNNVLEVTTNFEFKIRFLSNLFFSDTIEIDFIDMSSFNYLNVVSKSSFFITKNEIRQTIKQCKSKNTSKFDDILNRMFKILVDKLMSHLMNLFRVCATLNYHSRCFREIYIIILKKSKKKELHERQDVQIDRSFKHFRQSLEINDCATFKWFDEDLWSSFRQSNERTQKLQLRNNLEIVDEANSYDLKYE